VPRVWKRHVDDLAAGALDQGERGAKQLRDLRLDALRLVREVGRDAEADPRQVPSLGNPNPTGDAGRRRVPRVPALHRLQEEGSVGDVAREGATLVE
jgi:hypothetical protein